MVMLPTLTRSITVQLCAGSLHLFWKGQLSCHTKADHKRSCGIMLITSDFESEEHGWIPCRASIFIIGCNQPNIHTRSRIPIGRERRLRPGALWVQVPPWVPISLPLILNVRVVYVVGHQSFKLKNRVQAPARMLILIAMFWSYTVHWPS